MSFEGILVGLVLTALVGGWIALPFWRRAYRRQGDHAGLRITPVERQRDRLLIYYGRVLRNIHDLEEDFSTGKLNDADYRAERELWVQRGMLVLKNLDELTETSLMTDAAADDARIDAVIDDQIELAISTHRAHQG